MLIRDAKRHQKVEANVGVVAIDAPVISRSFYFQTVRHAHRPALWPSRRDNLPVILTSRRKHRILICSKEQIRIVALAVLN
jgi:hypothetical protein